MEASQSYIMGKYHLYHLEAMGGAAGGRQCEKSGRMVVFATYMKDI